MTSSASRKLTDPLGLFGGTFDPVHFGHLRLAEEAIGHLGLGGVRWIPAGQPPHRGTPQVTACQRLEMVLRSTAENARFVVDPADVPNGLINAARRKAGAGCAAAGMAILATIPSVSPNSAATLHRSRP